MKVWTKRILQTLQRKVNDETDEATARWGPFIHRDPGYDCQLETGMTVLIEELGKISRAHHKEMLAVDPNIKRQWQYELNAAFIKSHSILNRIYLQRVHGIEPKANPGLDTQDP